MIFLPQPPGHGDYRDLPSSHEHWVVCPGFISATGVLLSLSPLLLPFTPLHMGVHALSPPNVETSYTVGSLSPLPSTTLGIQHCGYIEKTLDICENISNCYKRRD